MNIEKSDTPTPLAGTRYFPIEEIIFGSFCPDNEAKAKPTEVHVHVVVARDYPAFIMRLKTPEAVNAMIAALIEHGRHVFGEGAIP